MSATFVRTADVPRISSQIYDDKMTDPSRGASGSKRRITVETEDDIIIVAEKLATKEANRTEIRLIPTSKLIKRTQHEHEDQQQAQQLTREPYGQNTDTPTDPRQREKWHKANTELRQLSKNSYQPTKHTKVHPVRNSSRQLAQQQTNPTNPIKINLMHNNRRNFRQYVPPAREQAKQYKVTITDEDRSVNYSTTSDEEIKAAMEDSTTSEDEMAERLLDSLDEQLRIQRTAAEQEQRQQTEEKALNKRMDQAKELAMATSNKTSAQTTPTNGSKTSATPTLQAIQTAKMIDTAANEKLDELMRKWDAEDTSDDNESVADSTSSGIYAEQSSRMEENGRRSNQVTKYTYSGRHGHMGNFEHLYDKKWDNTDLPTKRDTLEIAHVKKLNLLQKKANMMHKNSVPAEDWKIKNIQTHAEIILAITGGKKTDDDIKQMVRESHVFRSTKDTIARNIWTLLMNIPCFSVCFRGESRTMGTRSFKASAIRVGCCAPVKSSGQVQGHLLEP